MEGRFWVRIIRHIKDNITGSLMSEFEFFFWFLNKKFFTLLKIKRVFLLELKYWDCYERMSYWGSTWFRPSSRALKEDDFPSSLSKFVIFYSFDSFPFILLISHYFFPFCEVWANPIAFSLSKFIISRFSTYANYFYSITDNISYIISFGPQTNANPFSITLNDSIYNFRKSSNLWPFVPHSMLINKASALEKWLSNF